MNNKVICTKDSKRIMSSEILQPDINPFFNEYLGHLMLYPYPFKNNISDSEQERKYTCYQLENRYIKLTVLPDLGGKIYSCYDKRNDSEIFYCNPVIKPRLVGTTGAWTSGGVEFNFPLRGHRPSAVDYTDTKFIEYDDGSASIIISEVGMVAWMRFSVELRLYPDKAFLEQTVRLFNPGELQDSYYFWATSSEEETEDLEFRFPFFWHIEEESREKFLWPFAEDGPFAAENVDLRFSSTMKPFTLPFGSEVLKDYMGLHYHSSDRGIAHVADYSKVPGKKVWSWGQGRAGNYWSENLTNDDRRYVEMQAGDVETQNEFNFIEPFSRLEFTEYWISYFSIGPLCSAAKDVAASCQVEDNKIIFRFQGTDNYQGVNFVLRSDKDIIHSEEINLSAEQITQVEVPESLQELTGRLDFYLEKDGVYLLQDDLLDNSEALELITRDEYISSDEKRNSRMSQAEDLFKRRHYNSALEKLAEITADNPEYLESYLLQVRCYLKKGRYEKSLEILNSIKKLHPENPEFNYLFALTLWYCNDRDRAVKHFYKVPHSHRLFPAANYFLAEFHIIKGNYHQALARLKGSQGNGKTNYKTRLLKIYLYYKTGCYKKARRNLKRYLKENPFDYCALYFDFLITRAEADDYTRVEGEIGSRAEADQNYHGEDNASINNEDRVSQAGYIENIIHIFTQKENIYHLLEFFDGLNDWQHCLKLLQQYVDFTENPFALLKIYIDHYENKAADEAEEEHQDNNDRLLVEIEKLSLDYLFPNHRLDLKILGNYITESDKAKYLSGLMHFRRENYEIAVSLWEELAEKDFDYSVLYRNLAYYYQKQEEDHEKAIDRAEAGINKKPFNPDLINIISISSKKLSNREKIISLLDLIEELDDKTDLIIRVWIDLLNYLGDHSQAVEILEGSNLKRFEHIPENIISSRQLHKDSYLGLARQALEDKNYDLAWSAVADCLDFAYRYEEDLSEIYFYAGIIQEKQGDYQQALSYYNKVVDENSAEQDSQNYQYYIKASHRIVSLNWLGIKEG